MVTADWIGPSRKSRPQATRLTSTLSVCQASWWFPLSWGDVDNTANANQRTPETIVPLKRPKPYLTCVRRNAATPSPRNVQSGADMPQDIQQPRQICSFRSSSRSRAERSVLVAAFCELGRKVGKLRLSMADRRRWHARRSFANRRTGGARFRRARILRCSTGGAVQRRCRCQCRKVQRRKSFDHHDFNLLPCCIAMHPDAHSTRNGRRTEMLVADDTNSRTASRHELPRY